MIFEAAHDRYARVSTAEISAKDQKLNLQIEALNKIKYEKIFKEKILEAIKKEPELDAMVGQFRV